MATVGSYKSLKSHTSATIAEWALLRTHVIPELPVHPCRSPKHCYFTLLPIKSLKCLLDKDKFSIPLERKIPGMLECLLLEAGYLTFDLLDYLINMPGQFCSTNMFVSGCCMKINK